MMVMPATRLPKRVACSGSPVTTRAIAAPALKLSPAPQMSTGWAMAFAGTHCSPLASTTSAPFPPCVTIRQGACMWRRNAGIHASEARVGDHDGIVLQHAIEFGHHALRPDRAFVRFGEQAKSGELLPLRRRHRIGTPAARTRSRGIQFVTQGGKRQLRVAH